MSSACEQLLEQPDLVVDVEDGEIGLEADQLGMAAQDLHPDCMEGAEPRHAFHRLADHLADPQLHLPRRLVGEGHRQDFRRPGAAEAQDMGDARGEHAGLAGAGPGQHQHRSVQRLDRLALLRIEAGEIFRVPRRGPRTRGDAASRGLVVGNAGIGATCSGSVMRDRLKAPRWHREAVKGSFLAGIEDYMGPSRPVLQTNPARARLAFFGSSGGFCSAISRNFPRFPARNLRFRERGLIPQGLEKRFVSC